MIKRARNGVYLIILLGIILLLATLHGDPKTEQQKRHSTVHRDPVPILGYSDIIEPLAFVPRKHLASVDDGDQENSIGDNCTHYMTLVIGGRFGNLMAEYSSILSLSQVSGIKVIIPNVMKTKLGVLFPRLTLKSFDEEGCPENVSDTKILSNVDMTSLFKLKTNAFDHFKAPVLSLRKYATKVGWFGKQRPRLLQEFQIDPHIMEGVQSGFRRIRTKFLASRPGVSNVIFAGVHARRTDYTEYIAKHKGSPVSKKFFIHAMDILRKKMGPSIVFVAVSDDVSWIKEHFKKLPDVYYADDLDYGDIDPVSFDFSVLSSCNHSIYSYGTFGFFSAFLAGGQTILADAYDKVNSIGQVYAKMNYGQNWTLLGDGVMHR